MSVAVRKISTEKITIAVKKMCIESNTILGDDVLQAIRQAHDVEESAVAKDIFDQFLKNAEIARKEGLPLCQDTGLAVVFI